MKQAIYLSPLCLNGPPSINGEECLIQLFKGQPTNWPLITGEQDRRTIRSWSCRLCSAWHVLMRNGQN